MHLSIMFRNMECQLVQQASTSLQEKTESQSIAVIISLAMSKFALVYLQTFLAFLTGLLINLQFLIENDTPRWSELAKGGKVSHDDRFSGEDRNTRSMRELRVGEKWVGSETVWERERLEVTMNNFEKGVGIINIKSPRRIKFRESEAL